MTNEDRAEMLKQAIEGQAATIKQLQDDKKALQEEFAKASTYDETVEVARKAIADMLELSITTMNEILANGEKEAVRAGLAKFVVESVISGKLNNEPEGEIKNLIKRLAEGDEKFKQEATELVDKNRELGA